MSPVDTFVVGLFHRRRSDPKTGAEIGLCHLVWQANHAMHQLGEKVLVNRFRDRGVLFAGEDCARMHMEDLQALVILRSLANGVDPENGRVLDPENPVRRPQTVRALAAAVRALERTERQDRRESLAPTRAMAPGTTDEDRQLLERFDTGMSSREIGITYQRSSNAIRSRLKKLGRVARVS